MNLTDRNTHQIFSDLLPYLNFEEENKILWLRDGSAARTLRLTPRSVLSSTEDELEGLRAGLSSVVNQLPEGSLVQTFLIREKATEATDQAANRWKSVHSGKTESVDSAPRDQLFESKLKSTREKWMDQSLYQTKIYISIRIGVSQKNQILGKLGPLSFLAFNRGKTKTQKPSSLVEQEVQEAFQTLKLGLEMQGFEINEPDFQEIAKVIYCFLNPERTAVKIPERIGMEGCHDLSEAVALTDLIEKRNGFKFGFSDKRSFG